ncbi:serine/threonine protein kinase [Streptomyces sp. ISL-66]|uniref:serine/threonine-protein kinase n=1 Tax=Streptomyces sp. ISL-66 TaxID=2819186 RepID=UPI001BEBE858|nr:serine/threonine-protein kinase [Streptomyces sp. ISL-66]MBT2469412.1 serine/threonine protein kinase [Streptomyces sp. ISL-66]
MDGTTLAGRYELTGLIGSGGMGEVWRGRDLSLERDVAVKVIARPSDDKLALRLRAEAKAAAALWDPHVVAVHDFGETVIDQRTVVYLVMELVDGRPLGERGGRASVADVVDWGTQICRGLQAAHAAGIVHRDIKPANILLTTAGRIKICDFGIARQAGVQGLTTAGSVTGTPAYMSPEQARGAETDARSDLYGLGCVLYQLLTGHPPFSGTGWEILAQHAHQRPVSVRGLRHDVPVALDLVILSLLSKDPADRPPNAHETAERLRGGTWQGTIDPERWAAEWREVRPRPAPRPAPKPPAPKPPAPKPTLQQPVPDPVPRPVPRPVGPRRTPAPAAASPSGAARSPKPANAPQNSISAKANWTAFVLSASSVGGQLAGFGALNWFWAVVVGTAVGGLLCFSLYFVIDGDRLSPFSVLVALVTSGAILTALILAPHVPWWKAVVAGLGAAPVMMVAAAYLHRLISSLTRAKEVPFVANDVAMINGVLTSWLLLASTKASLLLALGAGAGYWLGGAVMLGAFMPRSFFRITLPGGGGALRK